MQSVWILLIACASCLVLTAAEADDTEACRDLQPERTIVMRDVEGMWNVIEVVEHEGEVKGFQEYLRYDSFFCPSIFIASKKSAIATPLSMVWTDQESSRMYTFRPETPGYWMILGVYSGATADVGFRQFNGSAQVTLIDPSHMVITFCFRKDSLHKKAIFSIVFAKEKKLTADEERDVRQSLTRVNLSSKKMYAYCSATKSLSSVLPFITAFLALLVGYGHSTA